MRNQIIHNNLTQYLAREHLTRLGFSVQGSFAFGTVIRPFRRGKDADYDLDIVCQSSTAQKEGQESISPEDLKLNVRDSIKRSAHHATLLDSNEGRRCWTLNYARKDGVGFHMDILPCVDESPETIKKIEEANIPTEYANTAIAITDKNKHTETYSWSPGNPRGLVKWFNRINRPYLRMVATEQKDSFARQHKEIFASVEDVPDALLKSSLQRVIQLLKRQRDLYFDGKENEGYKPISIVITVLASRIAESRMMYGMSYVELFNLVVTELKRYGKLFGHDYEYVSMQLTEKFIARTKEGCKRYRSGT